MHINHRCPKICSRFLISTTGSHPKNNFLLTLLTFLHRNKSSVLFMYPRSVRSYVPGCLACILDIRCLIQETQFARSKTRTWNANNPLSHFMNLTRRAANRVLSHPLQVCIDQTFTPRRALKFGAFM